MDLTASPRKARGKPGGVIHLFFFCASLLDEGQSVMGTFGESPNTDVQVIHVPFLSPIAR